MIASLMRGDNHGEIRLILIAALYLDHNGIRK